MKTDPYPMHDGKSWVVVEPVSERMERVYWGSGPSSHYDQYTDRHWELEAEAKARSLKNMNQTTEQFPIGSQFD